MPIQSLLIIAISLLSGLYTLGTIRMWRAAGPNHGIRIWQACAFAIAIIVLFLANSSPLEALSDNRFSAHMVQHMLLIMVVAPLLVISAIPTAIMKSLPVRMGRAIGQQWNRNKTLQGIMRQASRPVISWIAFAAVLWVTHLPAFYQAALENEGLHAIEHGLYMLTAILFWLTILHPIQKRHIPGGMEILYLFTAMLQMSLLGALLVFSSQVWYSQYALKAATLGFSAISDQQLAGLIMWLPEGVIFTLLCAIWFEAWLRKMDTSSDAIQLPADRRRSG